MIGAGLSGCARSGRGRGEVYRVAFPGLRLSRALATRTPAPAREPCGRAGMVLFAGEVPSPSPSRAISPRSGVWEMPGRHGRASIRAGLSGVYTRPVRGGERGERRIARCRRNVCLGLAPLVAPRPGSRHENPAPVREPYGRGSVVLFAGEGFPPRAPPRAISPRSGVEDAAEAGRARIPGRRLPGGYTRPVRGGGGKEGRLSWLSPFRDRDG